MENHGVVVVGSVLREDSKPDSGIDVLVTFAPEARWSLLDLPSMQDELSDILGRNADLVDIKGLRIPSGTERFWLLRRWFMLPETPKPVSQT